MNTMSIFFLLLLLFVFEQKKKKKRINILYGNAVVLSILMNVTLLFVIHLLHSGRPEFRSSSLSLAVYIPYGV